MKTTVETAVSSSITRINISGIRDLARLAGVDVSTVSRALNFDRRVNAERAKRIREMAEKHGYRPRPLRAKRTQAIGVLVSSHRPDDLSGSGENYLQRIAWIAHRVLGERKMHVNVECVLRGDDAPEIPAIVRENRVDGVLITGHPPVALVKRIRDHNVPVVAINDSCERIGVSCVRSDSGPAMYAAILKLAALGHRRLGLLMNELIYPTCKARVDGYRAALADIHIDADPAWLVSDLPFDIPGGREGIQELKRRGRMPSAVLCCNDWMALGAMMELRAMGVGVPDDVSVMGHDDLFFCEELDPRLTSISRSEEEMVAKSVRILLNEIEHGTQEPHDLMIEEFVVWRASTGPSPERVKGDIGVRRVSG